MLYDVYFTLDNPACMVVEANSMEEAKYIGEELLNDMDDKELLRRIKDALDFGGLKIQFVEQIDD